MEEGNFIVTIEPFAQRHFIKSFAKKYKSAWDITLRAIIAELERLDNLLRTDRTEIIIDRGGIKIVKTKFRVAGTQDSAKSSGNRCIAVWHVEAGRVSLLLVYAKTDLPGHNETAVWKQIVKDNYPHLRSLL
jgi:hypothetical protein